MANLFQSIGQSSSVGRLAEEINLRRREGDAIRSEAPLKQAKLEGLQANTQATIEQTKRSKAEEVRKAKLDAFDNKEVPLSFLKNSVATSQESFAFGQKWLEDGGYIDVTTDPSNPTARGEGLRKFQEELNKKSTTAVGFFNASLDGFKKKVAGLEEQEEKIKQKVKVYIQDKGGMRNPDDPDSVGLNEKDKKLNLYNNQLRLLREQKDVQIQQRNTTQLQLKSLMSEIAAKNEAKVFAPGEVQKSVNFIEDKIWSFPSMQKFIVDGVRNPAVVDAVSKFALTSGISRKGDTTDTLANRGAVKALEQFMTPAEAAEVGAAIRSITTPTIPGNVAPSFRIGRNPAGLTADDILINPRR